MIDRHLSDAVVIILFNVEVREKPHLSGELTVFILNLKKTKISSQCNAMLNLVLSFHFDNFPI